jgi:hypothetical protein
MHASLLGRYGRHPLLLVLFVKVEQHAEHRNELHAVLVLARFEELKQNVLQVRFGRAPALSIGWCIGGRSYFGACSIE